jgi:hypothetical protein
LVDFDIQSVEPEGLTTLFPKASVLQIQLSMLKIALVSKNKNPKQARLMGFYVLSHFTVVSDRGAGGNRTLVQTSNVSAFYMFSFRLVFDAGLTGNGLTNA